MTGNTIETSREEASVFFNIISGQNLQIHRICMNLENKTGTCLHSHTLPLWESVGVRGSVWECQKTPRFGCQSDLAPWIWTFCSQTTLLDTCASSPFVLIVFSVKKHGKLINKKSSKQRNYRTVFCLRNSPNVHEKHVLLLTTGCDRKITILFVRLERLLTVLGVFNLWESVGVCGRVWESTQIGRAQFF